MAKEIVILSYLTRATSLISLIIAIPFPLLSAVDAYSLCCSTKQHVIGVVDTWDPSAIFTFFTMWLLIILIIILVALHHWQENDNEKLFVKFAVGACVGGFIVQVSSHALTTKIVTGVTGQTFGGYFGLGLGWF